MKEPRSIRHKLRHHSVEYQCRLHCSLCGTGSDYVLGASLDGDVLLQGGSTAEVDSPKIRDREGDSSWTHLLSVDKYRLMDHGGGK